MGEVDVEAGIGSTTTSVPVGKGGFVGGNTEAFTVISRCPTSGRVHAQEVRASMTAMAAGPSTKVAINGFGRIGRNVLRCWLGRKDKPFDIVAINAGSMDPKTTRHLLMHDTVLGNLKNDVKITDDGLTIDGKAIKLLTGRDPAAMPWKDLDVEVIIESTGAFNSLVSSDFMQTDYSNSVDAALTMVMGEDLVKVVMWHDNEWGYSQRVLDMTQIVCDKL